MSETAAALPVAEVESAPFVQIANFLGGDQHDRLLSAALEREADFRPSGVVTAAADYRRSRVLFDLEGIRTDFEGEVDLLVPWVCNRLGVASSATADLEMQLTAHNDGDYFKLHNDNGSPETSTRVLSYVYYFNRSPRRFAGGELRLYDSRVENGFWVAADTFHTIEPLDNSIVFFVSRLLHEVLPIRCPTRRFPDSRFTVNGWLRSAG